MLAWKYVCKHALSAFKIASRDLVPRTKNTKYSRPFSVGYTYCKTVPIANDTDIPVLFVMRFISSCLAIMNNLWREKKTLIAWQVMCTVSEIPPKFKEQVNITDAYRFKILCQKINDKRSFLLFSYHRLFYKVFL